ncbi:hypothetical protein ACHHYP_14549 [Achlya hypogyna]|uniref:C2H2-type domain-containing protein n=1 Tax=Achlya hypogyna TaxID=1202772 RepID=A0A1V9YD03_ACHHY|nr:hypothetical protein ACHHYP_14549 [Achlya hypogyna]
MNVIDLKRPLKPGDLELAFSIDVFKQHIGALHARSEPLRPLHLHTVSDFGIVREHIYTSSRSIGEAFVAELLEDTSLLGLVSDLRCDTKGVISITTTRHFEWHTDHGRVVCTTCGRFFNGPRGLRIHQVTQHKIAYEHAQSTALATETQLVLYVPPQVVSPPLTSEPAKDAGLIAAASGDLATLQKMVAQGWDVQTTDRHGSNALAWAAGGNHVDVCVFLVDECNLRVDELQGKPGMKRNALHWAARNGHIQACEWLLRVQEMDVNSPTEDGTTPFHFAVWNQQPQMCHYLASVWHCNVHILNAYGCNASQWGALTGSVPMLELLQSYGVDLGVLNTNGHSALHKAALRGHTEACAWLLTHGGLGIRHMQPDKDGFTPTSFATTNGFPLLGAFLAEHCAAPIAEEHHHSLS